MHQQKILVMNSFVVNIMMIKINMRRMIRTGSGRYDYDLTFDMLNIVIIIDDFYGMFIDDLTVPLKNFDTVTGHVLLNDVDLLLNHLPLAVHQFFNRYIGSTAAYQSVNRPLPESGNI